MKRFFIFSFLALSLFPAMRAQTLTLEECQALARENYPSVSRRGLIEKTGDFTVSNAKRNWLPKITLSAQASYQSEVSEIPDELNGSLKMLNMQFEGLRKDQYKTSVLLEQIIYGGGAVKAQVDAAKAESEVEKQSWEIEMYGFRERINQLYFGALLLQEKIKEAGMMIEELKRNGELIQSYIENGIAYQNDLDKIQAEILSAKQQKSELVFTQKAYLAVLGIMIDRNISDETELLKPETQFAFDGIKINRPELNYFNAQEKMLEAQQKGINSQVKPQIGAFVNGTYGYPGLNLFADMQEYKWSSYFVAGIQLKWNISGFYTRKNKLSKIDLTRSQIALQKETFLYNMNLKSAQETIGIKRMYEVMREDDKIIKLRNSIRKRTETELENGTATVNDLLREMHAENLARQNKITHEIELLKNIYDLKYTTNN